ncbi:MAG: hypothetical protein AB7S38_36550 [Vulcanimicrobiota bacterium]
MDSRLLQQRAEQLANRDRSSELVQRRYVLSRWKDITWAFPETGFARILAGPLLATPTGARLGRHVCVGILLFDRRPLPVIAWSHLVGVARPQAAVYLVLRERPLALEVSADSWLEVLDPNLLGDSGQPRLADWEGLL